MSKATKTFFYRGLKITVEISEPANRQARAVGNRTAGAKPSKSNVDTQHAFKAGPFYPTFREKTWTIKCTEFQRLVPPTQVHTIGREILMNWAGWGAFAAIADEHSRASNGVALIYPYPTGCYFKLFDSVCDAWIWYEKHAYSDDAYVLVF